MKRCLTCFYNFKTEIKFISENKSIYIKKINERGLHDQERVESINSYLIRNSLGRASFDSIEQHSIFETIKLKRYFLPSFPMMKEFLAHVNESVLTLINGDICRENVGLTMDGLIRVFDWGPLKTTCPRCNISFLNTRFYSSHPLDRQSGVFSWRSDLIGILNLTYVFFKQRNMTIDELKEYSNEILRIRINDFYNYALLEMKKILTC